MGGGGGEGEREREKERQRELSFVFCMWEKAPLHMSKEERSLTLNWTPWLHKLCSKLSLFCQISTSAPLIHSQQFQCTCSSYSCRSYNSLYSPWNWVHCKWFNVTGDRKLYWQTVTKLNYSPDPTPIN